MKPVWTPRVLDNLTETDLQLYLEFSGSACIRGGGCNFDTALQVLYQSDGDVKLAIQRLLSHNINPIKLVGNDNNNNNDDHSTNAAEMTSHTHSAIWTIDELRLFETLFMNHGKNFSSISRDLRSKTTKECVEHYYLWKRSSSRNITPLRRVSPQHHDQDHENHDVRDVKVKTHRYSQSTQQHQTLVNACSSSEHQPNQITQETTLQHLYHDLLPPQQQQQSQLSSMVNGTDSLTTTPQLTPGEEQFPCKVCGRVFLKIKSRSAHMKRHKNER